MSQEGPLVSFRRKTAEVRPRALERFARLLCHRVARGRTFHCLVSGDAELRRLNRDFLGHDYPTDVLSFPSAGGDSLGEMAVSLQRAREQARRFGHPVETEIRILMLHGVLHLAGLDHETDGGRMARAEARWRRLLGLPAGLIARAGGASSPQRREERRGDAEKTEARARSRGAVRPGAIAGGASSPQRREERRGNAEKIKRRSKSTPEIAKEAEVRQAVAPRVRWPRRNATRPAPLDLAPASVFSASPLRSSRLCGEDDAPPAPSQERP